MLEQKVITTADRPARGVEHAARVADRVVVTGGGLIRRLRNQDELVPGVDQRALRAAAHRTGVERQPLAALRIRERFLVADRLPCRRFVLRGVHWNRAARQLPVGRFLRARAARHATELVVVLQHARVHLTAHLADLVLQHAQLAVERTPPRTHRGAQTSEDTIDWRDLIWHAVRLDQTTKSLSQSAQERAATRAASRLCVRRRVWFHPSSARPPRSSQIRNTANQAARRYRWACGLSSRTG